MGGGNSTLTNNLNQSDAVIVRLMMPVYYTTEETTEEEHIMAQSSWAMVLNNTAPKYVELKENDVNFRYHSAVVFFHDSFYNRLFNVHPMAKELFKSGMKSQGKFLVQMITLSLSELKMKEKFDKTLRKLAEIHHQRSVKAIECKYTGNTICLQNNIMHILYFFFSLFLDGIVGDILFWTLHLVLGVELYTHELHKCWIKIYSRMLQTIVPVAVALEVADGTAQVL